jgi:hypothetical protein
MQELHTQPISDEASDEAEARVERKLHSESTLDALIGSRLDDDGQPIARGPVKEFEDFVASRPQRRELAARHGIDAATAVEKFTHYNDKLREHGPLAGEELASDYYANTNLAKMRDAAERQLAETQPKVAKADDDKDVHPRKRSGDLLDSLFDNAENERAERAKDQAEFDAAKQKFAAIKSQVPGLTFEKFFKDTVAADRELCRDPAFAYRLVAASGTPVTELQKEMAQLQVNQNQQVNYYESLITDMEKRGELLSLERYGPAMMQLWERPDFVKTGDVYQDLRRANRIVELLDLDRLQNLERQSAVEKAHRNAPVRSAGGMSAAAGRNGSLDSLIASATSHIADD